MNKAKKVKYTDEFKADTVKQITERGFSVPEVAERLGIPVNTVYGWKARSEKAGKGEKRAPLSEEQQAVARLKAELKRVTEERDILKKAAAYFAKESL